MPIARMQLGNPIPRGASPVTLGACRLSLILYLTNNPYGTLFLPLPSTNSLEANPSSSPIHALQPRVSPPPDDEQALVTSFL